MIKIVFSNWTLDKFLEPCRDLMRGTERYQRLIGSQL